jgi:N-acetylmuramoyl-L-alanine amidase
VRIYRHGDDGAAVLDIQRRLSSFGLTVPVGELGRFGEATLEAVRAFQGRRNLRVDGLVGPDTWEQLVEAGFRPGDRTLYLHAPHMRGDDVRELQRKLNALGFDAGKQDGVHGPSTDRAIREFQRNVGEVVDGVVGPHTLGVLERMRPREDAHARAVVREAEELRRTRPGLAGQSIAIDAGEPPALGEPDHALALALAVADELGRAGAKPILLRSAGEEPSARERARAANEFGAAVCVSLRVATEVEAPVCAYFGSATTYSPAGEHLATAILEALRAALGSGGRAERLTIAMLRETRMPAVLVECPTGVAGRGDVVAGAIAGGIGRFLSDGGPAA